MSDQEKTEQPTGKRLSDFRGKGQVANSREITLTASFLGFIAYFWSNGEDLISGFKEVVKRSFNLGNTLELSPDNIDKLFSLTMYPYLKFIWPICTVVLVTSVLGSVAQTGILITTHPLKPDLNKLNPVDGLKKLFNISALFELAKSIVKMIAIFGIVYTVLRNETENIIMLHQASLIEIISYFSDITFTILIRLGLFLGFIALLDFGYKKWELLNKMKMSKQEVKDERKNEDGDPHMKAEQYKRRAKLGATLLAKQVPRADVIITNPTHFAVAIRYVKGRMAAPVVIAKGVDQSAFTIREIAKLYDIPIIENPPLARGIYHNVKVGQMIPEQFYAAVAEVLAFVYKIGKKRKAA